MTSSSTSNRKREYIEKLGQVLRDEAGNSGRSDRIEYWAQTLIDARYDAYWLDHRRHRIVGHKGARDALATLKKKAAALKTCIDELPADAVDALNEFENPREFWAASGGPGPFERKLAFLYDVALPELVAAAETADGRLISNPTRSEGPRKKGAEFVSRTAHEAYTEMTGKKPGRGGREGRKDTSPFIRFLGKILEVLEVDAKPAGQARTVVDHFKRRQAEQALKDERRRERLRALNIER